jgi:CDP-diacylglycerol--glycerol-3-phosphate 3-phosphatidyltransferase
MMYRQVPNQLTMLRLVLAGVFFVVLNQYRYDGPDGAPQGMVLGLAMALFILAALTDSLDGYLARRWKVESKFGRIMDPVCDKVLVIGALVYLAGPRFVIPQRAAAGELLLMASGVYPWMVVLIMLREMMVTSIRGELEGMGTAFAAQFFGKMKMILQSVTVPVVLLILYIDPIRHTWAAWVRDVLVYATVLVTLLSGWPYIMAARLALREPPKPRSSDEPGPR